MTGASSGIGAEFARQLARSGTDLVLVARSRGPLDELAASLGARNAVDIEVMTADLVDEPDVRRVEERLTDAAKPIDLLVNNAGRGIEHTFHENEREDEADLVKLDVLAPFRLTHAALCAMVPRGTGGIVNVSSVAGDVIAPGTASYCASKAFLTSFSQSVHMEVKPLGVHVTVVLPGFVRADASTGNPDRGLPAPVLINSPTVVRETLAAVEAGRAVCVPTIRYKVTTGVLQVIPRNVIRGIAPRFNMSRKDS